MKQYHIKFGSTPKGSHLAVVLGLIHGKRSVTGQFNVRHHEKHVAKFTYDQAGRDKVIADFKHLIEELGL